MGQLGQGGRGGPQPILVNGTDGSKLIVRTMAATLINDGVAIVLQFAKNRRLIVYKYGLRASPASLTLADPCQIKNRTSASSSN